MRMFTRSAFLSALVAVAAASGPLSAAVILNTGEYSENFDGTIRSTGNATGEFPLSGAQAAIPPGPDGSSGWVGARLGGTGTGAMSFFVDDGDLASGGLYSYGTTDNVETPIDNERALGSVASGTNFGAFGVEIVNNTGATRQTADISYIAEFWRSSTSSTGTPNTLVFGYSVGPAGSTSFLSGAATGFASLDLVGPAPVGANGPLDGDLAINQSPRSGTLTNLNWLPGESLYLRWQDTNDQGNDAGLAVDNFQITIPEPTSAALMLLAGLAMLCGRRPGC